MVPYTLEYNKFRFPICNLLYEIDFLTSVKDKICPLEVKSGNYRTHKSLDAFCNKFSNRIGSKYVVHTNDLKFHFSSCNKTNYYLLLLASVPQHFHRHILM